MDLEKEFKQMGSTPQEIKEVVYSLVREKKEIEKKIHLFKVLSCAKEIAQFSQSQDLESHNISAISFRHYKDYESSGNNLMFDLLNLSSQEIDYDVMNEKQSDILGQYMGILSANGLYGFDPEFINEEFKEDIQLPVSLLNNTEEKILELFLSKELKTALKFQQMQNELPMNDEVSKKLKI